MADLERFLDKELTRRDFNKSLVFGLVGFAILPSSLRLPIQEAHGVESGEPLWPVEFTRLWSPVHRGVANAYGITMLSDSLLTYGYATGDFGPYNEALSKEENLRSPQDESVGFCSHSAAARILFPQPPFESTDSNGVEIDYQTKMGLLTALATRRIAVGWTPDPDQIIRRLSLFLDGTAQWPFVIDKSDEYRQVWSVEANAVTSDGYWFRSDNLTSPASWFSVGLIRSCYDPYLLVDTLPDDRSMLIEMDINKVFELVYGDLKNWAMDSFSSRQASKDLSQLQ